MLPFLMSFYLIFRFFIEANIEPKYTPFYYRVYAPFFTLLQLFFLSLCHAKQKALFLIKATLIYCPFYPFIYPHFSTNPKPVFVWINKLLTFLNASILPLTILDNGVKVLKNRNCRKRGISSEENPKRMIF